VTGCSAELPIGRLIFSVDNCAMSEFQVSYVSIWSKDFAANRDVFANVLQIPISYEDEDIVVFATAGAQLVLQRAVDADAQLDGTIQFGLNVKNLDKVTTALRAARQKIELDQEDLGHTQRVTVLRLPSGQTVEFVGG
jgi:hypothetical protein